MRKLFLFFLLLTIKLYSQSTEGNSASKYIPNIDPKTPESNSIIKNIELPSGSYTGIFGYTIDLGKITIKGIDFPISLKYSTTGLKVNGISTSIGAGWNLDLGGVSLSRDIRGSFDEITQELSINKKYIDFNPNEENPLTLGNDSDYGKGKFLAGVTSGDPSNKPVLDAEKDYFIYSLLGKSGRFIQDSSGYFHTIPKDDIKVVDKNKIIDDKGNTYYFKEYSNATNYSYFMDGESDNVSRSASGYNIRLDSIKSFSNETIKFKYESDTYEYTSSYDKTIKIRRDLQNLFSCKDFQNIPFVSRTHQNIRDYVITEITYPNGRILFNYETNNLEVTNKKILKGVKFYYNDLLVKDYLVNSSIVSTKDNSKIIEISGKEKFNKKLFLFSVTDKLNKFNYEFDYYNLDKNTLTTTFPARFSGEEDYWGNFKSGSDFIPSSKEYTNAQGVVTSFKGANKKPVLEHSVIGSIKSIKLPTGGYQEVKYELDNHFDPNNIDIIENSHNFSVELSYTEILQGKTSSFTIEYNNQLEGKVINPRMYFYYEGINSVNFDESSQSLPTVEHYYADVYINDVRYGCPN